MGFTLENCCFCVDLRVGSLIIGYLGLIGSLILTLMAGLGLAASGYIMTNGKDEETKTAGMVAMVLVGIVLVIVLLYLIFDIILLIGLHKHKRGHVKAYLIFSAVFIVISILGLISNIASGNNIGEILKGLFTILISIYFVLVIRSYYLKMDDAAKRPAIYNTA